MRHVNRIARHLARGGAVCALLFAASYARAGYTIRYGDTAGNYTDNFTIDSVGGTTDVGVYLQQTDGTTTLTSPGLETFNFRLNFNNQPGILSVPSTDNITKGPDFAIAFNAVGDGFARAAAITPSNDPALADPSGRILLATVTFVGTAPGNALAFSADGSSGADFLLADSTVIDTQIANRSLVVTVVPEPASIALGGVAMAIAIPLRRRRASA